MTKGSVSGSNWKNTANWSGRSTDGFYSITNFVGEKGSLVDESIKKIDGDLNDAVAFQRKNFGELRNKDKRLDENIMQLSNVDKAIRSEIAQARNDFDEKLASKTKWELQARNVCYGSKGDAPGKFKTKKQGLLKGIKLKHVEGSLKCSQPQQYSRWGCDTGPAYGNYYGP